MANTLIQRSKRRLKFFIRGDWEGETYPQIAQRLHLSEGYLKDRGKELWDRLSEVLGRKVGKKTLRAVLEGIQDPGLNGEDGKETRRGEGKDLITPASSLALRLRSWFKALHYEFEVYEHVDESAFEWIISFTERKRMVRILVRGVEREAGISDVKALQASIEHHKTHEGWLVVERRISAAAQEMADLDHRVTYYTFDDLIDEAADFETYIQWLIKEVRDQGIDRYYVSLGGQKDEVDPDTHRQIGRSNYEDIRVYLDHWIADPAKEHISILGEFGTGKTWFALRYAWEKLQKYLDAKHLGIEQPRLPLVIQLRDLARRPVMTGLILEALPEIEAQLQMDLARVYGCICMRCGARWNRIWRMNGHLCRWRISSIFSVSCRGRCG